MLDDEDELPDEEDGRLLVGESELKDDVEGQDRDDGDSDVSDVARLTPRCAML